MFQFIGKVYNTVTHIGLRPDMAESLQRKVLLTNMLSIPLAAIPLLVLPVFHENTLIVGLLLGFAVLHAASIGLNYLGFTTSSRFLLCFMSILTTVFIGTLVNRAEPPLAGIGMDLTKIVQQMPAQGLADTKIFLLASIALPFLLFDLGEWLYMVTGVLIVIGSYVAFDFIRRHIEIPSLYFNIPFIGELSATAGFVLLLLAFYYMQVINRASEKQKTDLVHEVKEKNEELISLEEELRQNIEELEATNEEVERQRARLEQVNNKMQLQQLQLQESEERFKLLAEAATEGILILDEGLIMDSNRAFEFIVGAAPGETIGTSILRYFVDTERPRMAQWLIDGETEAVETLGIRYDHQHYPVLFRVQNFVYDGHRRRIAIWHDITQQKLQEQQKIERERIVNEQIGQLVQLSRHEAVLSGNQDDALHEITRTTADTLHVARCSIWFYDDEDEHITLQTLYEAATRQFSSGIDLEVTSFPAYFHALRNQGIIAAERVDADPRLSDYSLVYLQPLGIKSLLSALIRHQGRSIGIVCCEHTGSYRSWEGHELNFLNSISELISLAFETHQRRLADEALKRANHQLEQTLAELRDTQDHLVQSEKMAALGQLVAGVAHEINSPLGAIKNAAGALIGGLPMGLDQMAALLHILPDADVPPVLALLGRALGANPNLSTREERQYRMDLTDLFTAQGIPNPDETARALVRIGITHDVEPLFPLLRNPHSERILQAVYALGTVGKNASTILTAADRMHKIVSALKAMSYTTSDVATEPVLVPDNIDNVLTLYESYLNQGIRVERRYQAVPVIQGYPEELAQVWSNLLFNAIQAMQNRGTLVIDVTEQDGAVVVSFTDSGPGIPQDIQERIFEPFFTTKPRGEGTGLGLSIVRKILDKHQATIRVDSQPGRTTFVVNLPLKV